MSTQHLSSWVRGILKCSKLLQPMGHVKVVPRQSTLMSFRERLSLQEMSSHNRLEQSLVVLGGDQATLSLVNLEPRQEAPWEQDQAIMDLLLQLQILIRVLKTLSMCTSLDKESISISNLLMDKQFKQLKLVLNLQICLESNMMPFRMH